jgi:signal transduction histidine kinase
MSSEQLLGLVWENTITLVYKNQNTPELESLYSKLELNEFFDRLRKSIRSNDPSLVFPILDTWLQKENSDVSIKEVLEKILLSIHRVSYDELSAEQSQKLISDLLPIFIDANEYVYQTEVQNRLEEISQEHLSLEKLDQSKSDFISIAAHELKTPLTLMEGYSAMLREIIEQKKIFDEHILMLLNGMDSGSRRLREIINDMIDVSLIDNEMLSLSFQPVWLFKILERIKIQYQQAVLSRQIEFEIHRFLGDEIINFYDGERLFQAISNVVSNAIKYTPDGGKIIIDGRRLHDFLEVMVKDNGIGIDAHDQEKIFDKFEPIGEVAYHSSGKLKFKGAGPGLGLPIAKGIIEAHGGRIWVESDGYDEIACPGSTFHILLPLREKPLDQPTASLFEPLFVRRPKRNNESQ